MGYLLLFPFYVIFFLFMLYAAVVCFPLIMLLVFMGLLVMLFPCPDNPCGTRRR